MNNNRNNNRRRGRGNRNQGGGGGGNQANRIDSRARGNAPQLLDKYKKLAQDAQHNGDRVQAEYYLQFADHYFRVIADNKARQDEARAKRDSDRGQSDDDGDDDDQDGNDNRRQRRNTRGRRNDRDDRQDYDDSQADNSSDDDDGSDDDRDSDDNPFARPRRGSEGAPAKRARKPRAPKNTSGEGIDAAVLPPSISEGSEDDAPVKKPVRRRRKADTDSENAEAVS
ncbi:DUF4167 domain-containing protein [Qipengyuania sp. JC766]|uniref:DUF4167 domain-containing protein n=1 Tax=Qipengyuania sp. JC766 TaxID=3232139 RepID=UPI003459719E